MHAITAHDTLTITFNVLVVISKLCGALVGVKMRQKVQGLRISSSIICFGFKQGGRKEI